MPRKVRRWTRKDKRLVKLEVKQQSRKSKTVVECVRGLVFCCCCCCCSPGTGSTGWLWLVRPPVRQRFRRCLVLGAWCLGVCSAAPLIKRASKRRGERGACAFACPPTSTPPISPVSSPCHDWPEAPVGSAVNLNLACVQGVKIRA